MRNKVIARPAARKGNGSRTKKTVAVASTRKSQPIIQMVERRSSRNITDLPKKAGELGVTCALDPLVREPGAPPEIYEQLEASALYLRVENAGRAGALRTERLEDLAALIEHHQHQVPLVVAFASPERWQDARNLKKLLDG